MKALNVFFKSEFPTYTPVPDGKGSWLSCGELIVSSQRIGEFVIPTGSHNNLASIPKAVRSIISVNGPHRIAAIVHDYLYHMDGKLPEMDVTRKQADNVFFDVLRMPKNDFYRSLSHSAKLFLVSNELEKPFASKEPLVDTITAHTMWSAVRMGGWVLWG